VEALIDGLWLHMPIGVKERMGNACFHQARPPRRAPPDSILIFGVNRRYSESVGLSAQDKPALCFFQGAFGDAVHNFVPNILTTRRGFISANGSKRFP